MYLLWTHSAPGKFSENKDKSAVLVVLTYEYVPDNTKTKNEFYKMKSGEFT